MKNQKEVQAAKDEIKKSIRMALGKGRLERYFKRRNAKLSTPEQALANAMFADAVEKARHKFLLKFDDIVDDWEITTEADRIHALDAMMVKAGQMPELRGNDHETSHDIYLQMAKKVVMTDNYTSTKEFAWVYYDDDDKTLAGVFDCTGMSGCRTKMHATALYMPGECWEDAPLIIKYRKSDIRGRKY